MIAVKKPLFNLGQVLATPGALEALRQARQGVWDFVSRHAAGNWGIVDADDMAANEQAVRDGSRVLSAYLTNRNQKVWVITEAVDDHGNRAATTVLLPEEY